MNRVTLGTRGTDLVIAGLQLPRKFSRDELNEVIGKTRIARGDVLPKHWTQGTSNELHRLSSDFAQFRKEGRELDLIARIGPGRYCFRDEARPKLIDAANERGRDLLITQNTLIVPVDGDDVANVVASHVIGKYAQQAIMKEMIGKGYKIMADTSARNSYDFMFIGYQRTAGPQLMECKGTCRDGGAFTLTPNEVNVWVNNVQNYWFGVVYGIQLAGEMASGGNVFITPPPVGQKWQFTKGHRLERMREQHMSEAPLLLL